MVKTIEVESHYGGYTTRAVVECLAECSDGEENAYEHNSMENWRNEMGREGSDRTIPPGREADQGGLFIRAAKGGIRLVEFGDCSLGVSIGNGSHSKIKPEGATNVGVRTDKRMCRRKAEF